MANKLYDEASIQAIANAIRTKNGASDLYTVSQMPSAIDDIPTGGTDQTLEFYTWLTLNDGAQVYVPGTITQDYSYYLVANNKQAVVGGGHSFLISDSSTPTGQVSFRVEALTLKFGDNAGNTVATQGTSWDWILGEHTFLYDGIGSILIDGGTVGGTISYTNTTISDVSGFIFNGGGFYGQIKEFTITDTTNSTVIHHYVPCGIKYQETLISSGMFDTITNKFYSSRYGTCTATNEKIE